MIAEDDDMVRELLLHILRDGSWGHAACDVREALRMIAELSPDLVLSDLGMPEGLDG